MRNIIVSCTKKSVTFLLAVAMMAGALLVTSTETKAAEKGIVTTPEGIKYVQYDASDCILGRAPEFSGVDEDYGYLFGGWYIEHDDIYNPVTTRSEIDNMETGDKLYAKFVPAYVMSVKCQNFAGTKSNSTKTDMRIVSSVDSLNYDHYGFDLYMMTKKSDGTYTVKVMGVDGTQNTTHTYRRYSVYDSMDAASPRITYQPSDLFGDAAKYFTVWRIGDIPLKAFDRIIGVKPYWVTLDGVKVYGLSRYAHVEDAFNNYINVPINLQNKEGVAAGKLTVKYDKNKYTLEGTECGKMFEEITSINYSDTGRIECVGNVSASNISKNKASNDIYINLRFKVNGKTSDDLLSKKDIYAEDFDVIEESFSNIAEEILEGDAYNVWKVKATILK